MEEAGKKYLKLLKDGGFALLKSADEYFSCHYKGSPLNLLTGFSGTAGEALIDKNGKITLFVDPRYHEQADFETAKRNVETVKLKQGEGFIKSIAKKVKSSPLYISSSSPVLFFEKLKKEGLNVSTYEDFKGFGENKNIDFKKEIFKVNSARDFLKKTQILKKHIRARYMLVTSLEDIAYLTNLRSYQMVQTSVFVSKLFLDFSKNIPSGVLFCNQKIKNLPEGIDIKPLCEFYDYIAKIKDEIVIDKNSITIKDYDAVLKPSESKANYIAKMASVKEKAEIRHYKSAFERLDKALYAFKGRIKAGLSEYELKEIFEEELIKNGAKTTSFKTILALADNSSSIHYSNYDKNKILKEGDLILLDCGGYYEDGLATDITRVFLCGSKAGKKQKEIYTAVLKAFLNACHSNAKSGDELDKIARKILKPYEKEGFLFPHALGHGIGIPVHQMPPVITSFGDKKFPLQNNMTHTIEPGLYCSKKPYKFGVRLENSVWVTKKGKRESFSKFEFEENLIERAMLTKKEQKWLDEWQENWREFCEENIKKR